MMRTRSIRAIGLSVVLAVASLSPALVPGVQASPAAQTFTFTGSVSQSGHRWDQHQFSVTSTGTITAQLSWPSGGSNLNLFFENPSGTVVGCDCSQTPNAASLTYNATVTGNWQVAVKAVSGASTYTVTVTAQGGGSSPPPPPAGSTPHIPLWAPDWMGTQQGGQVSQSVAIRQAQNFSIIVGQPNMYKNYVSVMKQTNPALTLYVYRNGVAQGNSAFPESYYSHSASGARIKFPQWGTYEMNPKSSGWIGELTSECRDLMTSSGYGGCFLDVLGISGVNSHDITGSPINSSTGRAYTQLEWMTATTALAKSISSALAPKPVIGNGLLAGFKYFDPSAPSKTILGGGLKAGMVEGFVRQNAQASVSSYESETMWKQDVDMLVDIANRPAGNIAVTVTKVWTPASSSQILSWQKYALATFLLGWVPGHAYFSFRSDKLLTAPSTLYSAAIGTPSGSYAKINGVYQRTFTTGKVLVNPTTSSFTIQLGGSYRDTDGRVVTSITMAPHTGAILAR